MCVCVRGWVDGVGCIVFSSDYEAAMEEVKTEHAAALRKKETQVCV